MHRRRALQIMLATVGTATTAGCAGVLEGGDSSSDGETISPDGPEEPNGDDELTLGEIWYYLDNAGSEMDISVSPNVHDIIVEGGELKVWIELQGGLRNQRIEQIGVTAIMYAAYLQDHGGPELLRGYTVDGFGDEQQTDRCERDWAESFANEEVGGNELALKVMETLQPA